MKHERLEALQKRLIYLVLLFGLAFEQLDLFSVFFVLILHFFDVLLKLLRFLLEVQRALTKRDQPLVHLLQHFFELSADRDKLVADDALHLVLYQLIFVT